MTTFKEIQGRNIRSYTTNPDNPLEGQMWYNQTDFALKGVVAGGAWSSGANMTTGRTNGTNAGTLTAALAVGGNTPPITSATELYNGSGWSTDSATLNTARISAGSATNAPQTAAIIYGGSTPGKTAITETYNGTSWSEVADLNTARWSGASFGNSQTAAVLAGGDAYPPTSGRYQTQTEEFNGSSWSTGGALGTAGTEFMGSGIESAGLAAGGEGGRPNTSVEEYNGTAWTSGTAMPIGRTSGAMAGLQTASIQYGGVSSPSPVATTISYDGSAWTTTPSMAVAKYSNQTGAGSSTAAISAGSHPAQAPNAQTEEYNFSTNIITPGAWASGGNRNQAARGGSAMGTRDAQVSAGGILGSSSPAGADGSRPGFSEEYNGTSWTNLPTIGRSPEASAFVMGGCGTATAGLIAGGMPGGDGQSAKADEWDGSSWTEANAMSTARQGPQNLGVQTAAFVTGGRNDPGPVMNTVESYDGTNFSSGTAMSTARNNHSAGGTTSSGWVAGGQSPTIATTEEWNGSSWTASNDLLSATYAAAGGGPQTSAFVAGGGSPYLSLTQHYNGTSWATAPSISSARRNVYGSPNVADNSTGLIAGGTPAPANVTITEEFTGETTSINIVDITTS